MTKQLLKSIQFLLLLTSLTHAQPKLPIIKATSKKVSINDGGILAKNTWTLSPTARPDVYTADRARQTKYVTFYTDIDSIRVKVKPGTRFNFVILFNGKDSCYTQIASAIPPEVKELNNKAVRDTIPFTLTAYSAISFKAVVNDKDTVLLNFDTGSWDFRLTKEAIMKKTGLLSNQPEYLAGKSAPNFNKLNKVFKLQLGNQVFTNPEFAATDLNAHEMDGRFGWNLFEGKQIELDYDKSIMIIHSGKLLKDPKGYVKSSMEFNGYFVLVNGIMKKGTQAYKGKFLMDTGSETAMILDSTWSASADYPSNLKLLKTITIHNPRGQKFETKLVLAPTLELNGFTLTNIPALVLGTRNPAGFPVNNLGNDLLKRFNVIMDFKNDCIYWQPNKLFNMKYRENS